MLTDKRASGLIKSKYKRLTNTWRQKERPDLSKGQRNANSNKID